MSQHNSIDFESVTYLGPETTCGTHPGAESMVRLAVTKKSLLASGFQEAREENPDESVSRYDNPVRVKGLRRGSKWGPLKVQWKSIKTAARLSVGAPLPTLSHRVLFKHLLGAEYAAAGCTVGASSTTTSIVVDSTASRRAGELVAIELTPGGPPCFNKVAAVNDATHFVVHYPLPSAPEAGSEVRGMYTFAMAERRASTLTLEQKHVSTAGEEARALGAFGNLKIEIPDFGKVPTWSIDGTCVDWQDAATLSSPSFGASGPAADDMGPPIVWHPEAYLGAAIDLASAPRWSMEKFALDILSSPEEIPDAAFPSMVGGYLDTGGRENGTAARVTMSVRYDPALEAGFVSSTEVSLHLRNADPYGNAVVIDIGRMYLVEHTAPVTLGKNRRGMKLLYEVRRDTTTTVAGGATATDRDIAWTPVRIGLGG